MECFMMEKKILAVTGATGAQGGGLARAVLNDPGSEFRVRALTRDPNSPAARELAQQGAEVVAADVNDASRLLRAFEGAHAAFCVTFFWAHMSAERELAEARNLAEAAAQAGLQHVIWSTLEDTRKWIPLGDGRMPVLQGKYNVPHLDAKGEADQFFRDLGVPTTFLLTSFYWENFIYFGMGPQPGPDGRLAITLPMGGKKLPGIAAEDIGKCAYGILRRGREFVGRTVGVAGEQLTGVQMAGEFSRALGREVVYNSVSPDAYRGLGFPGADELGNMFQFKRDFEDAFCGARDPGVARSLNPELQDFRTWIERNAGRLPIKRDAAIA
jgi:uncharacterized protein YbjT (DUF2867 family)